MNSTAPTHRGNGARQLARKLALQAVYSWLVNPRPWQDLVANAHHRIAVQAAE